MRLFGLFGIGVLFLSPAAAYADAVFEVEQRNVGGAGEVSRNVVMTKDGNMRMTVGDTQDGPSEVIFRAKEKEMLIIDHDRREVRKMTEDDIESMSAMMGGMPDMGGQPGMPPGAAGMMDEALKDLPPEQRAQAEKMMQQMRERMAPPAEPAEPELHATDRSESAASVDCDVIEVLRGGQKVEELCLADPAKIEGSEELADAFHGMAEFYESLAKAMPGGRAPDMSLEPVGGMFPIITRQYENGRLVSESVLTSSRRETLDDALFEVPEGYRMRSLMK